MRGNQQKKERELQEKQERQFIRDDKGVVIIWTFGQIGAHFEDNARRGLVCRTALERGSLASATGLAPG